MKPFIRIDVAGGAVVSVESNLPGTDVLIYDSDAKDVGEDPRTTTVADFPPEGMEFNTERLTDAEIDRFEREMEGNLDGDKTTQAVLLHIISDSPQASALFRAWLKEAERHTRNAQRDQDSTFGLTFNSLKGSVLHTAFCFDTEKQAEMAAQVMFKRGNPDCLTEMGIWWDPLYAWQEPITSATIQTVDEDVRDILRPDTG